MREVARFLDAEEARVAAGFLRSNGFHIEMPEMHFLSAQPHLSIAVGGYRLLAPDREWHQAKTTLDGVRAKPKHGNCDRCGGNETRRARRWWQGLAMLPIFGAVGLLSPATKRIVCRRCGLTWIDDDDPQHEL